MADRDQVRERVVEDPPTGQRTLNRSSALGEVFGALDRMQIEWFVLHGHHRLLKRIESDVDLAVAGYLSDVSTRLATHLEERGLSLVGLFENPGVGHYCVFAMRSPDGWEYLHIDLHQWSALSEVAILERDRPLVVRRRIGHVWVSRPAIEIVHAFSKRVGKGDVRAMDLERWQQLLAEEPAEVSEALVRLLGDRAQEVERAIRTEDLNWMQENLAHLARVLDRPWLSRVIRRTWSRMRRSARHLVRPKGFIVAIVGPESEGLLDLLRLVEENLSQYHAHSAGDQIPAGPSLVRRIGRMGGLYLYWFVAWPLRFRSRIVVLHGFNEQHLIPRPDLVIRVSGLSRDASIQATATDIIGEILASLSRRQAERLPDID